jgi:hypothetical protein
MTVNWLVVVAAEVAAIALEVLIIIAWRTIDKWRK